MHQKKSKNRPKVFTWGTFDQLHTGHKEFLRRLSKIGRLYVIIIPSEIKCTNTGLYPIQSEQERRNALLRFSKNDEEVIIEEVFIDSYSKGLSSLVNHRPEFFCFGYDQNSAFDENLVVFAKEKGLDITFIRMINKNGNGIHSSHLNPEKLRLKRKNQKTKKESNMFRSI